MPVRMLVDTGASDVFVSASTAARLGLVPSGGRKRMIQTANGQSTASPTILRAVSLDGLYMNDVEALILAPEAGEVESARGKLSQAPGQRRAAQRDADPAPVGGLVHETRMSRVSSNGMS